MRYVASCSFGKDSLATILLARKHGEPLDEAVYCEVMFDKTISGEVPEHRDFIYTKGIPALEKMGIMWCWKPLANCSKGGGETVKRLLKDKRGEGFVDVCVLVLAIAMVLALVVRIAPVFVAKQNLDVFADELVRTAEINGQVGSATNAKAADLREQTGLDPNISWSDTGKIQLGNEVEVTLTTTVNIGLFGEFASFPVTLTAKASGTSEVYWK